MQGQKKSEQTEGIAANKTKPVLCPTTQLAFVNLNIKYKFLSYMAEEISFRKKCGEQEKGINTGKNKQEQPGSESHDTACCQPANQISTF